jgi:hypothetical protein
MIPDPYSDFSASELAEELEAVDSSITTWQNAIVDVRKKLDRAMKLREDLIDYHREKAQEERGYRRS